MQRRITPTLISVACDHPRNKTIHLFREAIPERTTRVFKSVEAASGGGDMNIYLLSSTGEELPYACIRDSSIPSAGKGVYTCVDIAKGCDIGTYCGAVVGWKDSAVVKQMEMTSECLIERLLYTEKHTGDTEWCVLDGSKAVQHEAEQRRVLGLERRDSAPCRPEDWPGMHAYRMNDAAGPNQVEGLTNNCRVNEYGHVIALRDIRGCGSFDRADRESELLWSYGSSYWGV